MLRASDCYDPVRATQVQAILAKLPAYLEALDPRHVHGPCVPRVEWLQDGDLVLCLELMAIRHLGWHSVDAHGRATGASSGWGTIHLPRASWSWTDLSTMLALPLGIIAWCTDHFFWVPLVHILHHDGWDTASSLAQLRVSGIRQADTLLAGLWTGRGEAAPSPRLALAPGASPNYYAVLGDGPSVPSVRPRVVLPALVSTVGGDYTPMAPAVAVTPPAGPGGIPAPRSALSGLMAQSASEVLWRAGCAAVVHHPPGVRTDFAMIRMQHLERAKCNLLPGLPGSDPAIQAFYAFHR